MSGLRHWENNVITIHGHDSITIDVDKNGYMEVCQEDSNGNKESIYIHSDHVDILVKSLVDAKNNYTNKLGE